MPGRAIVHLDMDCFYAQVEQRRLGLGLPPWTSKESVPLAVQQWDGLIAVNYAARACGVKRGMRAGEAAQVCPGIELVHVETLAGDGSAASGADPDRRTQKACLRRYRQASEEVFAIFARYGSRCEMASIDEAYLDLTAEAARWLTSEECCQPSRLEVIASAAASVAGCTPDPKDDAALLAAGVLVEALRADVLAETGFTVSAGIAENKMCAKLGSACHKPNRQTIVPRHHVRQFMGSVPLRELRGLGGKLGDKLRAATGLGMDSPCSELMQVPLADLQRHLGEQQGVVVFRLAQGIDTEEVTPNMKRKQYMSFKSFQPWIQNMEALDPWLASLAEEVVERLRDDPSRQPKTMVLQHRGLLEENHARNWIAGRSSELTRTVSRSCPFPAGPPTTAPIVAAARKLLREKVDMAFPCSRLAIGATDFVEVPRGPQISTFFTSEKRVEKAGKFGSSAPFPKPSLGTGAQDAQVANFHRASRLHFLGTWRERFEQWQRQGGDATGLVLPKVLATLRLGLEAAAVGGGVEGASAGKPGGDGSASWAHLDMDCFFASVATRDLPEGDTVPIAVTSGVGPTSEICSANYAARKWGVTTALWTVERAMEVLPTLRIIPVSEELLKNVETAWQQVYQLLVVACGGQADRVVLRSCDEASLRVEGVHTLAWAQALKTAVRDQTGCTCSVGIGPSQVVAKLAVKACKPDGARHVLVEEVNEFLANLPTSSLPQVGRKLATLLEQRGLACCRDVLAHSKGQLREWFGAKGEMLWANTRGQDFGAATQQTQRKSMSAEINWGVRVQDRASAVQILAEVAQQLADRLTSSEAFAAHVTLKLKIAVPGWVEPPWKKGGHGHCDDVSRSAALPRPSQEKDHLLRCGTQLFDSLAPDPRRVRGVGLAARLAEGPASSTGVGLERWFVPPKGGPSVPTFKEVDAVDTEVDDTASEDGWCAPLPPSKDTLAQRCGEPSGSDCGVIDLEALELQDSTPSRPETADRAVEVQCPVCQAMQAVGSIETHVNSHFDKATLDPSPAPKKKPRRTLLDFAATAVASSNDCEFVG